MAPTQCPADYQIGDKGADGYYLDCAGKYESMYSGGRTGLEAQLFFLAIHICIWSPFTKLIGMCFHKFLAIVSKARYGAFNARNKEVMKKAYNIEMDETNAGGFGAEMIGICTQHITGMMMCVPAVFPSSMPYFGITDPAFAIFLAKQGALCEAGWELGDTLVRIYMRFIRGDPNGTNPNSILLIMAIHHFMGIGMVTPMNCFFGGNPLYHETVFMLQGAAAVALLAQQFGFTLNLRVASELFIKRIFVLITFVLMWYSRAINYGIVYYKLVMHFVGLGNTTMIAASSVGAGIMGLLNLLFVIDSTKAFMKYILGIKTKKAKGEITRALSMLGADDGGDIPEPDESDKEK